MDANRLLLAALLLFAVLLGATELGRLSTEVRALAALTGGALVLLYLRNMPRANDLTDKLVLAGLLLFLLTCITSSAPRASFDAATSAAAYAAAFYLARGAFADNRNRRMAITLLGLTGVVIGVIYLGSWGSIWLRWMAIPGAGAPPFDLRLPAVLYRHQYLVGMLAAMLLPATVALARRPVIWPLGMVGAGSTFLVALMSGGRTVWLAGVSAAILVVLGTRGFRPSIPRRRVAIITLALAVVALAVIAVPLVARLGNTYTIELRLGIWGTALSHWLDSVVVGFGPGSFARELPTTGYYSTFQINVPHAHNALVQALFEGGLIGIVSMGLVCAGVVIGAVRSQHVYWSAVAAIAFVAVASATDNPTVFPFLIVPLIVWAALASPRTASAPGTPRASLQLASLGLATVAAAAVISTFAAAWAFDRARDAADADDEAGVVANLNRALAFDPSFALYHRELGAWLAPGHLTEAKEHLRTAIDLNPSDTQALRTLAVLYARDSHKEMAIDLTSRLVVDYGTRIETALTVAYINATLNNDLEAQAALVSAVRRAPWLTAAPEWKQVFPDADTSQILRDAYASGQNPDEISPRNLHARVWLAGLVDLPPPEGTPIGLQLQSAVLRCQTELADQLSGSLTEAAMTDFQAILGQVMFQNAFGTPSGLEANTSFLFQLRDPGLARLVSNPPRGPSPISDAFQDVTFYDRIPLSPHSAVTLPTSPGGLGAWLRDPVAAARAGAPDSGLAECS